LRAGKIDRSLLKGESFELFSAAIRSPATRDPYERKLLGFLKRVNLIPDEFAQFAKESPSAAKKKPMRIKIGITFSVLKKQGGLSIPSNHIIYYKTLFGVLPKKKFNLLPYEKLECDCRKLKSLGALEKVGMKSINF
jgi:hypothetical protein